MGSSSGVVLNIDNGQLKPVQHQVEMICDIFPDKYTSCARGVDSSQTRPDQFDDCTQTEYWI